MQQQSDATKENVIVTHINNPLNFWINPVEKFELVDTVMKLISQEEIESHNLTPVRPGMPCVALSAIKSEKSLVRAQILFCEPNGLAVVHLIDSGDRERVKIQNVYEMPPALQQIPALAKNVAICGIRIKRTCLSAGCEKSVRQRATIKKYFEDLTTGGSLLCLSLYFGYPSRVDLYLSTESSSVSNLLLQKTPFLGGRRLLRKLVEKNPKNY